MFGCTFSVFPRLLGDAGFEFHSRAHSAAKDANFNTGGIIASGVMGVFRGKRSCDQCRCSPLSFRRSMRPKTFGALMEILLRKELPNLQMENHRGGEQLDPTERGNWPLNYQKSSAPVKLILEDQPRGKGRAVRHRP